MGGVGGVVPKIETELGTTSWLLFATKISAGVAIDIS